MKSIFIMCVMTVVLSSILAAQNPAGPVLQQQGVPVQLPVLRQAVAVPDADRSGATVVTVSARGDVYLGADPVTVGEISGLRAPTVYLKADARAPYQQVLTVLSALSGRKVVLLTEATVKAAPEAITPPYGIAVTVAGQ
jgi:biopolymer transport protein ExbD